MNRKLVLSALPLLLGLVAMSSAHPTFAADPPTSAPVSATVDSAVPDARTTPQIDDSAMALLQKVQATMLGLKTFHAEVATSLKFATGADGKQRALSSVFATVTAAKPGFMHYEQWEMKQDAQGTWTKASDSPNLMTVGDGKTVWNQFGTSYRTNPYTSPGQLSNGAPCQGFYSEKASPYADVMNEKKEGELIELSPKGEDTVDGVVCRKVFVHWKPKENKTFDLKETFFIGPDNLIHREMTTVAAGEIAYTSDAMMHNISVDVPVATNSALFAYVPAANVKPFALRPQPVLLTKGVAAPEITAVDKAGAVVKLSDFKGKVVVVDFWASWCPPCKASMPHNQEVIAKLQAAKVPVVLLAVDNSEAQPAFAKWVQDHPEFSSLDFVFADPKTRNVSGDDYHVTGIPTQYIIDPQGMIQASFVGYGGPTDDMANAVMAAAGTKTASK